MHFEHLWPQRPSRYEVDVSSDDGFDLVVNVDHVHKVGAAPKRDQQVDVAAFVVASNRSEHCNVGHAARFEVFDQFGSVACQQRGWAYPDRCVEHSTVAQQRRGVGRCVRGAEGVIADLTIE